MGSRKEQNRKTRNQRISSTINGIDTALLEPRSKRHTHTYKYMHNPTHTRTRTLRIQR